MALRKIRIERRHKTRFLGALFGALLHVGVEIPNLPKIGDRHVRRERPPIDEDDAVFSKEPVGTAVVDKTRHKKRCFGALGKIGRKLRRRRNLLQALAGM